METTAILIGAIGLISVAAAAYFYWRYVWFFRNPRRTAPERPGILSPADGTVVYAYRVPAGDAAISIKQGVKATVKDISKQDEDGDRFLVGVFMSPFNVHYNRAPVDGEIEFIRHYPPEPANVDMGPMHRRIMLKRPPYYRNSRHIVVNERTVTKIAGRVENLLLPCYVVQIAGKTVRGIEHYVGVGDAILRGEIFGMIRIGSQVDLIVPALEGLSLRVKPGDKVRAGETILIA